MDIFHLEISWEAENNGALQDLTGSLVLVSTKDYKIIVQSDDISTIVPVAGRKLG